MITKLLAIVGIIAIVGLYQFVLAQMEQSLRHDLEGLCHWINYTVIIILLMHIYLR